MDIGQSKERLILKSALILTVAGIITKILSAAYRIPFQNIAGDIGFYVYQQVYPFYGIALVLSTYGFPVVISKLVAEQLADNKYSIIRMMVLVFSVLALLFLGVFIFIYTFAERIALDMGDPELVIPLKIVAVSFLFVPALSVLRGYFQGYNNMTPTAISQIGEQSVRVTTILVFSYLLLVNGYSVYISSAGAVFGSVTGGLCSSLLLGYFFLKNRNAYSFEGHSVGGTIAGFKVVRTLLGQGLTICLSSLFLILLQFVDAMTVYSGLIHNDILSPTDAKIEKGVYDRGQPLIQLGTVVATSLSLALVPLISSANVRNDQTYIKEKVQLALRVSAVFGLGAALGLIGIIKPTNVMLFENTSGSGVLSILAITILFTSITMTATAIIQGLDKSRVPAIFVVVGILCKVVLNPLLIPQFGTSGAACATVISVMVTTLLNIGYLLKLVAFRFKWRQFKAVLIAGLAMVLVLYGYQFLLNQVVGLDLNHRAIASVQALSSVAVGGIIYLFVILKAKVFTEEELMALPFGAKLKSKL